MADSWESNPFIPDLSLLPTFSKGTSFLEILEVVIEADVPVPDRLRTRSKELIQIRQTRVSQKVGILLYLTQQGSEYQGVVQRLMYLQSIVSEEAIEAALNFANKLTNQPKLVSDYRHLMSYFLSTPYVLKDYRKKFQQRIRGYRDKGTLPDPHLKARNRAQEEGWISVEALDMSVKEFLKTHLPPQLFEGDFLFLPGALEYLQEEEEILSRLREILLRL